MTTRVPIRAKVGLALLVPVVALVGLGSVELDAANRSLDEARGDAEVARVVVAAGGLSSALLHERSDAALSAAGRRDLARPGTPDLASTRLAVDAAEARLRAVLAGQESRVRQGHADVLASFDETVRSLRDRYDGAPGEASLARQSFSRELWSGYSSMIGAVFDAGSRLMSQLVDPQLRHAADLYDAVNRSVARLDTLLFTGIVSSLTGGEADAASRTDVVRQIDRFEEARTRIDLLATGTFREHAISLDRNPADGAAVSMLEEYVSTGTLDVEEIVSVVRSTPVPTLASDAADVATGLTVRSGALVRDATSRRTTVLALGAITVVTGALFTILAVRWVARPARSLVGQADLMARHGLRDAIDAVGGDSPDGQRPVIPPARITVNGHDEARQVAASLNTIQDAVLADAARQAHLRNSIDGSFADFGRRTQNLTGRQLELITGLARGANDPDVLDKLARLSHLAHRSRRNAKSLLVLSGAAPRQGWSASVAMDRVVQAAVDGVEHPHRVTIHHISAAQVLGRVVPDLVHLLAELIENGLSFSAKDQPVEIHGRMTTNGYVVSIVDHGMGMGDEDLARANQRLAGTERRVVALPGNLGLVVAGTLARATGVAVTLSRAPSGGVAARLVAPAAVLDGTPALPSVPSSTAPAQLGRPALPAVSDAPLAPVIPIGTVDPAVPRSSPTSTTASVAPAAGIPVVFGRPPARAPGTTGSGYPAIPETPAVPVMFRGPLSDGPPPALRKEATRPRAVSVPAVEWKPARSTPDRLQRRVPGAQFPGGRQPGETLARRGTPAAEIGPPADSAAADVMFSLLRGLEARIDGELSEVALATTPEPRDDPNA